MSTRHLSFLHYAEARAREALAGGYRPMHIVHFTGTVNMMCVWFGDS